MIKLFNGERDLLAWIKNLKMGVKHQKISDLASFMPLFLEGDALTLFLEMCEEDQWEEEMIVGRLKETITEGPITWGQMRRGYYHLNINGS